MPLEGLVHIYILYIEKEDICEQYNTIPTTFTWHRHSHQQQHQHVYGAKHPPLTGSALAAASSSAMSASGGGGSGGGASGSSTSGGGGKLTSSFKDFERTTENVWDLDESERDDDDIGADNIMTSIGPKYSFRISIPVRASVSFMNTRLRYVACK